jgi:hypothetical protein
MPYMASFNILNMKKIDLINYPLNNVAFFRKIDFKLDKEFKKSFLNILFLKIFGNQNADCLYEVLTFQIDESTNTFRYGRIVTEELSRESIKYNTPNSLKMFNGELLFENQNYLYRTTNFKSNLLDLWLTRTNKKTDEIDNLVYNTLIFR